MPTYAELTYAQLTDFADCLEPLYEEMRHQEQLTLVRSLLDLLVQKYQY